MYRGERNVLLLCQETVQVEQKYAKVKRLQLPKEK